LNNLDNIFKKSLRHELLNIQEALLLYQQASTPELMSLANNIRNELHPNNVVTWLIDRNINITNVCVAGCKFCNFHTKLNAKDAYITSIEEYEQKIAELFLLGGNQLLLQGGLHPKLGLSFYTDLFGELKTLNSKLKLHALGPPEIVHLSKIENKPIAYILERLVEAGLDSLPGAGAEILSDRVRRHLSPAKCTTMEWLTVMRTAHKMNIITSATMMFGHIETIEERLNHLLLIRDLQQEKPADSIGFIAFIPWTFQDENTRLKENGIVNNITNEEYIRTIAISRILLPNVPNIQASWLTVGVETGQICLHAGANDFGSIMIEENVVSAAGANYRMNIEEMQNAIKKAGYEPQQRNQEYKYITI